jgi:uncharacterized protein (DUF1810 family)
MVVVQTTYLSHEYYINRISECLEYVTDIIHFWNEHMFIGRVEDF